VIGAHGAKEGIMQKRLVGTQAWTRAPGSWLDLEQLADVELTSEDPVHPIEGALTSGGDARWRAAERGTQSVRLLFQTPQRVQRIRLRFDETEAERTQEFVLRWSPDGGHSYRDIVRQQYTFSPAGATSEVEELTVDLAGVTALELTIMPDQRGQVHASLTEWRVG
jgi:hypothetical protein